MLPPFYRLGRGTELYLPGKRQTGLGEQSDVLKVTQLINGSPRILTWFSLTRACSSPQPGRADSSVYPRAGEAGGGP